MDYENLKKKLGYLHHRPEDYKNVVLVFCQVAFVSMNLFLKYCNERITERKSHKKANGPSLLATALDESMRGKRTSFSGEKLQTIARRKDRNEVNCNSLKRQELQPCLASN